MSTTPIVRIYIEQKPEHYVSDLSICISCKPSERWRAEILRGVIDGIEGWDWRGLDDILGPHSDPPATAILPQAKSDGHTAVEGGA